jgi:hypothetical protein
MLVPANTVGSRSPLVPAEAPPVHVARVETRPLGLVPLEDATREEPSTLGAEVPPHMCGERYGVRTEVRRRNPATVELGTAPPPAPFSRSASESLRRGFVLEADRVVRLHDCGHSRASLRTCRSATVTGLIKPRKAACPERLGQTPVEGSTSGTFL